MDKLIIDHLKNVFDTACAVEHKPLSGDELLKAYAEKIYGATPVAGVTSEVVSDNDKLRTIKHTCDDTWQVAHEVLDKRSGNITYINQNGLPCDKPHFLHNHKTESAVKPVNTTEIGYCPICDGNGYHSYTCPKNRR